MMNRSPRIILIMLFALCVNSLKAQTTPDSARNTAPNFFRTYDSIPYLTFDVRYTLYSDTAYSDFSYETIKGTYTLNGRRGRYSLGDVEYLQNDSFLVAVYHKDEQIIIHRSKTADLIFRCGKH